MNYFSSDFKLGILGGGQLGKMMLYDCRKFDIHTSVMDGSEEAPCKIGSNEFTVGDLMNEDDVFNFGKEKDVVTIEIENVSVPGLKRLEKAGVTVFPSSKTLEIIQNKAKQKLFHVDHNIPTASFSRFAYSDEIRSAVLNNVIDFPFVWKSAQFGYDGTGVKIIRSMDDIEDLPRVECIVEEIIDFEMELSVIVARSAKGEVTTFPVVEMEFHPEANQVEYVISPARIPDDVAHKAELIALKTSAAFEHVGLLAVEMFYTKKGDILVNEVAPRPHNSGHQTIESCSTSQFEQHLRAILGLPLGDTSSLINGIMVNLVGAEGYSGSVKYENIEQIMGMKGVTPHIYGKRDTRPFRKMGHVTIVHEDMKQAREIAGEVKKLIKVISE